jgi:hypothetical protein
MSKADKCCYTCDNSTINSQNGFYEVCCKLGFKYFVACQCEGSQDYFKEGMKDS